MGLHSWRIIRSVPAMILGLVAFASSSSAVDWSQPVRLSADAAFSGYPDIAVNGDDIAVVWHDLRHGEYEIYCTLSQDGGQSWGPETRLTNSVSDSRFPQVAFTSDGALHVVFQDNRASVLGQKYDIYYLRSPDGGTTWESARAIATNPGRSIRPDLATSGLKVYVAWSDISAGMFDIYFSRSLDSGATWSTARQLTSKPDSLDPDTNLPQQPPSLHPRLAAIDDQVSIAWYDCRHDREPLRRPYPDNYEIYTIESRSSGEVWGLERRLTDKGGESINPDITYLSPSQRIVAWCDTGGNDTDIYIHRGLSNSTPQNVSEAAFASHWPRIAKRGPNLGLVWHDNRDDAEYSWQLYFRESTDGGATWSDAQPLLQTARFAGFASMAADGDAYYVVFQEDVTDASDDRTNNFEIKFIRSTGGTQP